MPRFLQHTLRESMLAQLDLTVRSDEFPEPREMILQQALEV